LIVLGFPLLILFIALYLRKMRLYEEGPALDPEHAVLEVMAVLPYMRRLSEVMLDVVLIALAYYGAYVLRWDADLPPEQVTLFARTLPVVIVVQMLCFLVWGVYRGLRRYVGFDDLLVLTQAELTGVTLSGLAIFAIHGWQGPSRAILILFAMLLLTFVGGSRLSMRLLREVIVGHATTHPEAIPVLIYGAGDGGARLVREIRSHASPLYVPIGFIDDDDRKVGGLLQGYRVFGPRDLPQLIDQHGLHQVLISSAKIPDHKLEKLGHLGVAWKRVRLQIE
jgi:UDP-GlcNAc:undecaprenyl-phosphate/decaprenyl-phosphate GlcNAc-1-phosphate transferase